MLCSASSIPMKAEHSSTKSDCSKELIHMMIDDGRVG
jgi:hypothetical protein